MSPYTHIPEHQKLIIQVFTKDVYERPVIPVKDNLYEFWQPNANTLYFPWATDLLPKEIDENIQKVEAGLLPEPNHNRALFLGTVSGGEHGNHDQIRGFKEGCHRIELPFEYSSSTSVEQTDSIRQVQRAVLAPSIVGRWQKEKGYIPCRIFKTISYGHIGVTNSKEAYEIVGRLAIYESDETALAAAAIKQVDNRALRLDAMRLVRDRHTYLNRLDTIQTIFAMKQTK